MVTKPDRIADLTKFAKITKNRKFDDFSRYMYLGFLAVYVHFHFSKFCDFFNFSQFLPLRTNLDIRADDVFHIRDLIDCSPYFCVVKFAREVLPYATPKNQPTVTQSTSPFAHLP